MDETLIKKLTAIVESQKQLEDDLSKVDISSAVSYTHLRAHETR